MLWFTLWSALAAPAQGGAPCEDMVDARGVRWTLCEGVVERNGKPQSFEEGDPSALFVAGDRVWVELVRSTAVPLGPATAASAAMDAPAAAEGDTRLFLMNGLPLRYRGKYAAFRRIRSGDDIRSNIHAGGRLRRASIDDNMLKLAEMVRPRLVEDGMFLVGLDIVGDKLMEINVFSPGGLGSAQKFEKVNFTHEVLAAIERKVQYMQYYRRNFSNVELATL